MGFFEYSSSVHCCHLFLISSVSVRPLVFLSFIVSIFAWNSPLMSLIFFKKRSLVFPILLFSLFLCIAFLRRLSFFFPFIFISWRLITLQYCSTSLLVSGTLHSARYILSFSPLTFTSLLFSAICTASSDNHFAFLFLGDCFDHRLYDVMNLCP